MDLPRHASSAATSAQRRRGSGQAHATALAYPAVARSGGPDDRAPSAGWSAEPSHQAGEGDSRHLPNLSTVVEAYPEEHDERQAREGLQPRDPVGHLVPPADHGEPLHRRGDPLVGWIHPP